MDKKVFICILVFFIILGNVSLPVYAFSEDSSLEEGEENDYDQAIATLLASLGYSVDGTVLTDIARDWLVNKAMEFDYEAVVNADIRLGDGTISQAEYNERLLYILYENFYLTGALVDDTNQFVTDFQGFSEVAVEAMKLYLEENYNDYVVVYSYSYDSLPVELCDSGSHRAQLIDFLKHGCTDLLTDSSLSENKLYYVNNTLGATTFFVSDVTGISLVLNSTSVSVNDVEEYYRSNIASGLMSSATMDYLHTYNAEGVREQSWSGRRLYVSNSSTDFTWDNFNQNVSSFGLRRVKNNSGYIGYWRWFVSEAVQPILVFKSEEALSLYLSGQMDYYRIPSTYTGGDITVDTNLDYDALYDTIRDAVSGLEGASPSDIQQAINDAVSGYLEEIEFNTAETNTWLQRIYERLGDIKQEVSDGFFWVKTELAGILAVGVVDFLWDELEEDFVEARDSLLDVATLATKKFPFCIPTDIVAIISIFDVEPVPPDFSIPLKFLDYELEIPFTIDTEILQPFIDLLHAFVKLLYLVALLFLSVTIMSAIKEAV